MSCLALDPASLADAPAAPDGELFAAFREHGSRAAFTALVERHAGLVHGTCRRVLGDGHPLLEDACQAVFLALLRRPERVREPAALSGWLYWQARRIAGNASRREERRRRHERAAPPPASPPPRGPWDDIAPMLDQAIASLSALQREAVVRHFLAGEAHADLARDLGVSETATKKRVADALGRLRSFFAGRGVAIGLVALAGCLAEASAAPAPGIVAACTSVADGGGSATAQALAAPARWWPAIAGGLAVLGALALGAALASGPTAAPPGAPAAPPAARADADAVLRDAVLAPLRALRDNDPAALLATMTPPRRALLEAMWTRFAAAADPARDARIDRELQVLLAADGAERVAQTGTLPEEFRRGLHGAAELFARFAPGDAARLLGDLDREMAAWSARAALGDDELLRRSGEARVAALRASRIASAADLRRLDLAELLRRSGPAMAELKRGYRACGLDLDAALDSVRVEVLAGDGDLRAATVSFTAFDRPHAARTDLLRGDAGWRCLPLDALVDALVAGTLLTAITTGSDG